MSLMPGAWALAGRRLPMNGEARAIVWLAHLYLRLVQGIPGPGDGGWQLPALQLTVGTFEFDRSSKV